MNKLCYRIVFNKTRGMCMAVAETARSRTKAPGQGMVNSSMQGFMHVPALRRIALLIGTGLGGVVLAGGVSAQIVADPNSPGKMRPTVLETANGVVQVNIQTPSAAGVSRNVYSQFDVPKSGVILNNSRTDVQTQIGGWVQGNPWLATGTAKVILNEVNSSNPSRLQGYIEVAGSRAETIIANPAGIAVEGGGFINVSRATLTTGSPILENGSLKGYSVQRGQIVIGGEGLDASKTDYTALIARSVQVNAGLWAQRLNVITGINEVEEAALASVTQASQATGAAPLFAVDVAQLGGMYANQIYMVGTEAGVGVRNAGGIGAGAGELIVTSSGRLENSGTLSASQRLQMAAGSLANAGQIKSAAEALITMQGEIDNGGGRIEAGRIDLKGAALRNVEGTVLQTGASALLLKAEQFSNASGTLGRQSVAATTDSGLTVGADSGVTSPGGAGSTGGAGPQDPGQAGADAPGLSGPLPVLGDGRLEVGLLDNASGLIASNGEVTLNTGTLENRSGVAYLTSLSVTGPSFDNTGGLLTVLNAFNPQIESFDNDQGKLLIGAAFDGGFGTFSNRQGLLQATHLTVDVTGSLDNSGGTLRQLGSTVADIVVGGELALGQGSLDLAAGLRLRAGSISGSGSVLNVTGDLDVEGGAASSAQGKWIVGGDATLRTGALDNSGGTIWAGGTLSTDSADLNNASGTIAAKDVTITAGGAVDNSSGIIQATRNLALNVADGVVNRAGSIEALSSGSVMSVSGASIDNREGRIANAGTGRTSLEAAAVINGGLIGGNGAVEIAAKTIKNEAAGSIRSVENLELAVRDMLYNAGRIDTGGSFRMAQDSAQFQNSGSLVAVGDIDIAAETIDNTAGTIATVAGHGSQVSLQAATLHNKDGSINADGHGVIEVLGHVDNERGRIRSNGDLTLSAGQSIENRGGSIETLGRMQVHGGEIANHGGTIAAASTQAILIEANRGIDNNGLISANGQLTLKSQTFDNGANGAVSATSELELAVSSRLVNDGGTISTAGALHFDQGGAALANSGAITSADSARFNLDLIDNDGGTISTLHGASIDLKANALSNRGGRVMAGADVTVLVKGDIDSDAGVLQGAGAIEISAGGALSNQRGVIEALGTHGTLAVHAASIDNTNGRVANVGDGGASVSATGHVDNSGLIASNGQLDVKAVTVNNAGTVSSTSEIELAVISTLNNSGTISAASRLHIDQASAALRNSGTMVAGGPIEMTVKTVDNAGGKIATAQGANADVLLTAQNIGNEGGAIMSERNAAIVAEDNFNNRYGLVQAKGHLQIGAGGLLDASGGSIQALSSGGTLTVHAGVVLNELGRIVNMGHGETLVRADTTLVSSGEIGGNGVLGVEAQSLVNMGQGSIAAGGALVLQAHDSLENAGVISSGAVLTIDESMATLSNRGTMVAKGDIAIRATAIDNSGGTLATTDGSGASVTLQGTTLFNRDGRIVADRALALAVSGALDNTRGMLQGVDSVRMTAGGNLTNDSGVIEATAAHATLVLQANAVLNGTGRMVNVGDGVTTIAVAESLASSGLIAGNGLLDVRADSVVNQAGGTLASGGAMTVSVGTRLDNAGAMQSGAALHVAARTAEVHNTGLLAAGGALTLTSAAFDNDGGQLATFKGSGGDLKIDAASISNRGGAILSDRDAHMISAGGVDNTHGTLQAAGSLALSAAGAVTNDGGVVETLDSSAVLSLRATTLDNGNGRIVNVGEGATTVTLDDKLSSRGLIAGNGSLTLDVAELENQAGASIAAGTTLDVVAARAIANAGVISSQEALTISAARVAVGNSGEIVSRASATLDTASFDNSGGTLGTVAGRGGDIVLNANQIINAGGRFLADGAARITSGGVLDNRLGELRANTELVIDATGALSNTDGVIEAAGLGATLNLRAESIENTGGRMVNVGSGATSVAATNGIVNTGMLAANGSLDLSAATIDNLAAGTIAAGGSLNLHVGQALENAGAISAAGTLTMEEAAAYIANSGKIVATDRVMLHGASISNDHGQVVTGADIDLYSESTLSNRGGVIAAAGNVTLSSQGDYDNSQGQVQTQGRLQATVGGALANAGGALEAVGAASTLALQAASIDNTAGRVVNAGTGATTVGSTTDIVNSGMIAGNGALALSARTLLNTGAGVIGSGDALELGVLQELVNSGVINSAAALRFDQAAASFSNTGRIGAGGAINITADTLSNRAGQLYTANNSGTEINLRTNKLDNSGGTVSADGLLQAAVAGNAVNGGGTLHGGTGALLNVGGALSNSSGTIEAAAGALEIEAASVDSSGRIVNAGTGATSLSSATDIVNSGMIAGNGALTVAAQTFESTNSGTIGSAGALQLAVRQLLNNAGTITSGQTLHFDQASASLINNGRIGTVGSIDITAAAISNDGGQMYTVSNSHAAINLRSGSLDNIGGTVSSDGELQVVVGGGVANNGGTLHGGTGTTLDVGSALANGSGTIEAAAGALAIQAQSIDSTGRIVNAGTGATTIDSTIGILNSGMIAGNGALVLSAETLQNSGEGTIAAGAALDLAIRQQLANTGAITSQRAIRFEQAAASLTNTGRIGAGSSIDITAASVTNNGGQMYTVSNSAAAINLHTGSLDNTGGTVSADGLLVVEAGGSVANSAGLLRGGTGATLEAGGALDNGTGAVEAASGVLAIQVQSIDNSGRIVNAGTGLSTIDSAEGIVNSGTIAGNGALDLHASVLQNEGGGKVASGQALLIDVDQQLTNAGTISSGGTLTFDQAAASFANSGAITAAGSMRFTAASFDNNGGQISTVRGSGTDITIASSTLRNRGGAILADRNAAFSVTNDVDNSQGTLQAGNNLVLTTSGSISNTGGVVETLGAGSSLTLEGAAIDNGSGRISNAGSGDTGLRSVTSIRNAGVIEGMGNVLLSSETLLNQAGAVVASGGNLTLGITRELVNQGKINSAGTLTFDQAGAVFANSGEMYSGGNALINASSVNNDGGRLGTGTGSGADLTLTSQQLSNREGSIATDRDLVVNTHTFTAMGELFGGRDLALTMDGDYVQAGSVQNLRSNRDLSLSVSGNITNTSTMEAAGILTLSGQQITNVAAASIEGAGVILNASGNLTNNGEINGEHTLEISAANVSNSGGIVGGNVSLRTGNLDNSGSSALIGAAGALDLGVAGILNNTGGATLYSSGDMVIGNHCCGTAGAVNNISSTIEAGGSLTISADSLRNVRENVEIVKVKTVDETVHMTMPSWYKFGENYAQFDTNAANYRVHDVYFVSPSDILEDQEYVTPDGYTIHRAVIRTRATDSAFQVAASGLYGHYGAQSRLALSEETRVIYYTERAQVANPDQGAPAGNAIVLADNVREWSSTVSFSNQYGNCSSDCIRLITQPGYDDPRTTIFRTNQRSLGPVKDKLEVSRDAHHVAMEDRLAPGAGAVAQILSGGDMRLTVSNALENRFGDIKAKGRLILDGDATINNVGATLYRTHTFDGTWRTYGGQTVAYQQPTISQVLGNVAGVFEGNQGVSISGRSFSNVDITAGTVGNIRDAINVIGSGVSGASSAGAHVGASASTGTTAGAYVAAGVGIDDAAGTHVAAGTGVGVPARGQVSGSDSRAQAALPNAVAATGDNHDLSAGLGAAASGIANHARAGGKMTASGYANKPVAGSGVGTSGTANDTVANGAVNQSGVNNNEHLITATSVSGNNTSQGNVVTTNGLVVSQQASSVQGAALGGVMKVAPSGLFIRNPDAKGSYLFETRPQFASQKQWASSDYLLQQLEFDPATTQKRLGDGFYEQRLVREQLAELTGHKSYSGASDDSIYSQLLTNAVSAAKEFGLRPGVALSTEQVRRLTSDIVWMESQTVMLPDGSTETVLVPKVYLAHVNARALQPSGALLTGNGVTINTTESIVNSGGVIDGGNGRTLLVAGQDIVNRGGTINGSSVVLAADRDVRNESLAVTETYDFQQNGGTYTSLSNQATITTTGTLDIMAGRDLSDLAGKITAGSAILTAGQNVDFGTIRTGNTYQSHISDYTEKNSSVTHQLSQISTAGDLKIAAKGDLNLIGTQVSVGTGGSGNGQLLAGKNITISAVTNEVNTSAQNDPNSKQYDKRVHQNQAVVGADVTTAGSLIVGAGILDKGGINIAGSSVAAGDQLKLTAADSINIGSMQEKHVSDTASTHTSGGSLRSKTTQQADYVAISQAIGSALSGKTVDISAGKDINVLGSAIAGDGDVSLVALGNVNIGASTSTMTEQHHTKVKESGFLSGGGFGISYGTRVTTTDQSRDATTQSGQSRSMVGSIDGNLNVSAGKAVNISGSDLSAGQDMILTGQSVAITPGADDVNGKFSTKMTQTGLTLAVGGSVVNAVQTAQSMNAAGAQTSGSRHKALAAAAAVMTAKDTVDDLAKNGPSIKVSLTVGRSESESTEVTASRTHGGSVVSAGNNVIISATGGGKASNLDIVGSDVRAAGNLSLVADNQVNLLAAQDTESQHSKSKSWSASVGVAAEFSTSGGPKVGYTASVSASRGNVDGDGTTQVNSHVGAGNRLTIASGGDTNLKGAVASGSQVVADVKGNLNIESLQDTAKLDGKRQSISASGTIGAGGGFSASASNSKVRNDYGSVQEQSGIRAGDGGFQVNVAGNTDLKGGVISSSERAIEDGRNSLTTGTLSFSDLQNRDSSKASGISLGVNVGKNQSGDTFSPSMAPGVGKVSETQGSTTRSGISVATLTVGDQQVGHAVENLNRDVTTGKDTSQALTKAWTGAQALDEAGAQMQITSAAMPRLAKEIGDYAKTRMDELKSQGNTEEAAKWAEGGIYRVAAHTALGAMGGGLGGAVGAAAAAEAAPTIDELQKAMTVKLTDAGLGDNAAEVAAKLIAGGTAGVVGSLVGGGAGAASGLNADANNRQLHIDETTWIKKNANRFAAERGISVEEATRRLAQQASRDVDLVWRGTLPDTVDKEAQAFLTQAQGQTFTNSFGQRQALFSTQDGQLTAAQNGLFEVDKTFVNKYVTPYATRKALDGVNAEIRQAAIEVIDTLKHDPGGVAKQAGLAFAASAWNAVRHPINTANDLIESTESSAKTFGEGVAASTNKDIQRQLNSLYGQDVTSAVQIATSVQGALMLGSALGAGKVASQAAGVTRDAIQNVGKTKSLSPERSSPPVAEVEKTPRADDAFYRDAAPSVPVLSSSSGTIIRADPNKTTTVLGTYADDMNRIINEQLEYPKTMNFLDAKPGYFNVLNTPDELYDKLGPNLFWQNVNEPFLKSAIERGDNIYIATKPTATNVLNPNNSDGLSGFGREIKYLTDRGYVYDPATGKMCFGGCK